MRTTIKIDTSNSTERDLSAQVYNFW